MFDAVVARDEIGYIFAQSQAKLVDLVLSEKSRGWSVQQR